MKENTGAVHVQIPVAVATFLLNEKRADIQTIELRHKVNVLLIPNQHMETPVYQLSRLRHDQLNQEEIAIPSYRMVDAPAEPTYQPPSAQAVEDRPLRMEAAVRGITPAQPAPVVVARSEISPIAGTVPVSAQRPGIMEKIFGWFRGNRKPPPAANDAQIESAASAKPVRSQRGDIRNPRGGQRGERRDRSDRGESRAAAGSRNESAEVQRSDRPPRPPRTERSERGERQERGDNSRQQNRPPKEPREPREPRESRENREPREPKAPREAREQRTQSADAAANLLQGGNIGPDTAAPPQGTEASGESGQRSRRGRRGRRNGERGERPQADVNVVTTETDSASDKAVTAAARPATEHLTPSDETYAPVAVGAAVAVAIDTNTRAAVFDAPLPVAIPKVESAATAASTPAAATAKSESDDATSPPELAPSAQFASPNLAAISPAPVPPIDLDAVVEASGLVMVQTDPQRSGRSPLPESPQPVLGRRPRPPAVVADEPLQQVETQK